MVPPTAAGAPTLQPSGTAVLGQKIDDLRVGEAAAASAPSGSAAATAPANKPAAAAAGEARLSDDEEETDDDAEGHLTQDLI